MDFYKALKYPLIFLLSLLFASCQKEDEPQPEPQIAERTVLVWLAGDNNLHSEVTRKLSALAEGFRLSDNADCRLIVFADRRGEHPQLIEIAPDGEQRVLETYPDINSASADTLRRFLGNMMALAPAKRYGLMLFSHATGWLPQGALENPTLGDGTPTSRTVFDDNGDQMTLADFADALPQNVRFDYIVCENCFMGGVEVAYALREKADRLIVSSAEILSPGFEEIYSTSLHWLLLPNADLNGFAADYFNYRNAKSGNHRSATVSVINTANLTALAELSADIFLRAEALDEDMIGSLQSFNRHKYKLFFDLEEYLKILAPEREKEISSAIAAVVDYSAATPDFMPTYSYGFHIATHCGLTVYIPQSRFPALNAAYAATAWHRATHI